MSHPARARRALRTAPTAAPEPAPAAASLSLSDGARAELRAGALELRDRAGRLLVRYAGGHAEIAAPDGDLLLSAPAGRVAIRSALDVVIEAERDVRGHAGRTLSIGAGGAGPRASLAFEHGAARVEAESVGVAARRSRVVVGVSEVVAQALVTTAERVVASAERYELTASRLVTRARDSYREVTDLCESHLGRTRTLVRDLYAVYSRRAVLVSKDDTAIDGKRVLLG